MRVVFLVYPGFDILDLGGPIAAFSDANVVAPGTYETQVVSALGGLVQSSSGVAVNTRRVPRQGIDTVIAVGGYLPFNGEPQDETTKIVTLLAKRARRVTSVCTGAFLLAASGLLNGKRATTHWKYGADLQSRFPQCRVHVDRIYVRDGRVWTSAGSTAGIDLALALIEDDLGNQVSQMVARGLVVSQRRLGGQSQYSALLELESGSDRIRQVLTYIRANVREPLSVPLLADVAHLSVRQFSRAFLAETGVSPAKAIERIRAEVAKPQIEESLKPLDEIARATGFSTTERMRQAFVRSFGRPPQAFRRENRAFRRES